MTNTETLRARVRAMVSVAFDAIPAVWPIGGFIATNPLGGLEHRPFADAIVTMRERTNARGFLDESYYRERYAAGLISRSALEAAFDRAASSILDDVRVLFGRTVSVRDILWLSLTNNFSHRTKRGALDVAAAVRVPSAEPARVDRKDERSSTVTALVNERMACWCAAFLDDGQAAWPMPYRELGFYEAWRRLAPFDTSSTARVIPQYRALIRKTLPVPEDAIAAALAGMNVERSAWPEVLTMHAVRLPGWGGLIKHRASAHIDPVQYLAIRLWYERALEHVTTVDSLPERAHSGSTNRVGLLANIASALELSATEILALGDADIQWLLQAAEALDEDQRGLLWLRAHEHALRQRLFDRIRERSQPLAISTRADAVFCIDARSEGLRRHLEAQGPYRTRGFAGFFGLPIALRDYESGTSQQACPVLITPKHEIEERIAADDRNAARYRSAREFLSALRSMFNAVKGNTAAPFVLFESLGLFFSLPLMLRTLAPGGFAALRTRLFRLFVPKVRTTFTVDKTTHAPEIGLTRTEQVYFAEAALALMNMRYDFARLVLFTGHGSTTENNPFEASLDCGACAGYRGGPNARILSAILNAPEVRKELRTRGIWIPDTTVFIAGEHDTATDRVMIYDAADVPVSHRRELALLQCDLAAACAALTAERDASLPPGDRSVDWAQVRPEWGLARNAAFIIAPRTFTEGVDLERRAFMHEYDVVRDTDGALLEIIMTAPLIVAQWINSQYYFATVDNERYGSGTKVIQNVVGGIGVLAGNRGDLRAGLPIQSLADGRGWYHEPVRLQTIVVAPRARIDAVIARNAILQRLFNNEWILLSAWDPDTSGFWTYTTHNTWRAAKETTREPLTTIGTPNAA